MRAWPGQTRGHEPADGALSSSLFTTLTASSGRYRPAGNDPGAGLLVAGGAVSLGDRADPGRLAGGFHRHRGYPGQPDLRWRHADLAGRRAADPTLWPLSSQPAGAGAAWRRRGAADPAVAGHLRPGLADRRARLWPDQPLRVAFAVSGYSASPPGPGVLAQADRGALRWRAGGPCRPRPGAGHRLAGGSGLPVPGRRHRYSAIAGSAPSLGPRARPSHSLADHPPGRAPGGLAAPGAALSGPLESLLFSHPAIGLGLHRGAAGRGSGRRPGRRRRHHVRGPGLRHHRPSAVGPCRRYPRRSPDHPDGAGLPERR